MDPMLMTPTLVAAPQMLLGLGTQLAPIVGVGIAYAGVAAIAVVGSLLRLSGPASPSLSLPPTTLRITLQDAERRLDEAA
jgi:hypothetical protein